MGVSTNYCSSPLRRIQDSQIVFLDDDPGKWGQLVEAMPVIGPLSQFQYLAHNGASLAIIVMPNMLRERIMEIKGV